MKGSGADFHCPNFGQALKSPHGPGEADKEGVEVFKIFYRPEEDRLPFLQYRNLFAHLRSSSKQWDRTVFGPRRFLSL